MLEAIPIRPMLIDTVQLLSSVPSPRIASLGENTLSGQKTFTRISNVAQTLGISVESIYVDEFDDWIDGFNKAQQYDLLIIGSQGGIANWDNVRALQHAQANTRVLSTTYLSWMMPYAVMGCTQIPEEQGEWVGASAIAMLEGFPINDIAVVTNRKYETWVKLLERSGLRLNAHITSRARKYN